MGKLYSTAGSFFHSHGRVERIKTPDIRQLLTQARLSAEPELTCTYSPTYCVHPGGW